MQRYLKLFNAYDLLLYFMQKLRLKVGCQFA